MRKKIRSSFRLRLTLTVVMVILIPVLLVMAYVIYRGVDNLEGTAQELITDEAIFLSQSVKAYDDVSTLAVTNMSRQPSIIGMEPELQEQTVVNMADVYSTMFLIHTSTLDGTNTARSDGNNLINYADRDWFQAAASGEEIYRQSVVSRTTGEPVVGYSAPIQQGDEVVGVAFVGTDLTTLAEVVGAIQLGETGFGYVVDEYGNILAHPDPALSSAELVNLSDYAPVVYALSGGADEYSFIDEDGVEWLSHTQPVGNGWQVIVQQQRTEALAALPSFSVFALITTLLLVGMIGFLTYIVAGRAVKPIENLTVAATAVSTGHLNETVEIDRADEIGILATAFNSMTLQLRDLISNLETRVSARTEDLNLAAVIGQQVAQARNVDDVLNEATTSIKDQFNLYQVQIYLTDRNKETLVLRASDGFAGSRLLKTGHQLPIDDYSLNGTAAYTKQAVIVADTHKNSQFRPHPLLPDTRSEMVVPLMIEDNVLGVMDLQSTEANSLTEDVLPAFTVLAGQLAIALMNARQNRAMQENQRLMRTIIDASPDWIFVKNHEHRYQVVNQAYANAFHISPEEFVGKNDLDLGFPEEIVKGNPEKGIRGFWADDREIMDRGETKLIPEEPGEVDGKPVVLQTVKAPLLDNDGNAIGIVGFVHDITNRKEAENIITKQADELLTVAELSTAVAATSDPQQLLQEVVELTKERFELYHAHIYLIDESGENLVLSAGAGKAGETMVVQGLSIPLKQEQSLVARAARSKEGVIVNDVMADLGFLPNPLLPNTRSEMAVPMIAGNKVLGVLDVQSDVAHRFSSDDVQVKTTLAAQIAVALQNARQYEQTQLALREAQIFRQLADASSQGVSISTMQGKPIYTNRTLAQILGIENEGDILPEAPLGTIYPEEIQTQFQQEIIPSVMEQGSWQGELWIGDPEQPTITYETHFLLRDDDGRPTHAAAIVSDITAQKENETNIRANQTLMRTIIDNIPDWIILKNLDHQFLMVNESFAAAKQASVDEFIGKNDIEVGEDKELVLGNPEAGSLGYWAEDDQVTDSGIEQFFEGEVPDLTGDLRYMSTRKMPFRDGHGDIEGLMVFVQDITDIKRAEAAQIKLTQEMENQLAQVNALQRAMTREGWQAFLSNAERGATGFAFSSDEIVQPFNENSIGDTLGNLTYDIDDVDEISYNPTQTAVTIPLQVHGESIGVIGARSISGEPLSAEQQSLLTTLSAQVAETLDRVRLFEETETARSQTDALFTGSEQVVRATTMKAILTALVEATALKNMERASILFFDQPWEETPPETLIVGATWRKDNAPSSVPVGAKFPFGIYPVVNLLDRERPFVITDIETETRMDENTRIRLRDSLNMRSVIFVPLVVGSQWIGFVMSLSMEAYNLSGNEIRQISSLTGQAATVAQSQRLYQEAASRAEREQILRQVSDRVYAAPDAETVLRTAAREIGQALGLETFIYLEDPETN